MKRPTRRAIEAAMKAQAPLPGTGRLDLRQHAANAPKSADSAPQETHDAPSLFDALDGRGGA